MTPIFPASEEQGRVESGRLFCLKYAHGSIPAGTLDPDGLPEVRGRSQFGVLRHRVLPERPDDENGSSSVEARALNHDLLRIRVSFAASGERMLRTLPYATVNLRSQMKPIFQSYGFHSAGSGTSIVVTGLFQDGMELAAFASLDDPGHHLS